MSASPPDPPLLGPDDPPPVTVYNASGAARVLIVCDHAGPAVPRSLDRLGLADWVFERHVAYDIGAGALARSLADLLDAPAVLSNYSRLVVDPNRRLDDPTAFLEVSDGIAIPGNLDLTDEARRRRAAALFEPYHAEIARRLDAFRARRVTPAMVAVHTCTPVFDRIVRRWHVGVMWDRDPRIAVPLIARLSAGGAIAVGDNEPYSGRDPHDFTLDHHAEAAGLPYVGLEVRQDLVGTGEAARRWAEILAAPLAVILAAEDLYRPFGSS